MKRGIIAAPGIIENRMEGFSVRPNLTQADVRFYILYWDKVILPTNNIIHLGIPDEDELVDCGAIWRPRVTHNGKITGEMIIRGQCEIADLMMKDKSTDWTIHQCGKQIFLPDDLAKTKSTIRIDLISSLPVPSDSVHISDILDFKERRGAELVALHSVLDELYFEILKSPDSDLSAKLAIARLGQEVSNLNRVMEEKYKKSKKFDLSAEFSFSGRDTSLAAAGGMLIDYLASGCTIPIATTIAGLASLVKVSGKATKTFSHAENNDRYAYLSKASSENILASHS